VTKEGFPLWKIYQSHVTIKGFLLEDLPSHVIMLSLLVLSIDRQLQIRTNNKVSHTVIRFV
jgi:hypothetical protein